MKKFNNGRPYHGSPQMQGGRLKGATDTDYFYFFCPTCPNSQIMRILDYVVKDQEEDNPYNKGFRKKAKKGFTLVFQVYCENCKRMDFVKISNMGWQTGTHKEALEKLRG